jgi:MFS transporter, CP family, cyanate transporter
LIVMALNLRIAIAAVSPLLVTIEHDTGISTTVAGVLTTVPVVCFGAFALTAPRLIARFGMTRLLWLAMVVVTCGILVRLAPSLVALFAGTAIIGCGIAVGNVLLPGLIKRDFQARSRLMLALYGVALFVGAAIPAGLTVPIQHGLGIGWRLALALWAVVAVVALLVWAPYAREGDVQAGLGAGTPEVGAAQPEPVRGLWRDRVAWFVTAFMGLQSLGYYATLSWLPTLFEDHGMTSARAGWMLSYSTFPGMAAALLTPVAARWVRSPVLVMTSIACCAGAYAGLIAAPVSLSYLWMTLLGIGQGILLNRALTYIVARAPDSHHAAHLSTMAQGVGYLVASAGPFALGALHDLTGGWTVPLIALMVVLLPMLIAGLGAGRERLVLAGD